MSPEQDTLSIGTLYPGMTQAALQAEAAPPLEPANHPEAAAAARAKIAQLSQPAPFIDVATVPAAPTADLITNKVALSTKTQGPEVVRKRELPSAVRPILTAVGIFALTILLFKSPIIVSELQYQFSHKPSPTLPVAGASAPQVSAQDTISIPKLNVQAPVIYMTSTDENDIENSLENGVIHYASTAVPGTIGNVAIFGHSSNDWWQPGNYKFVFVLLDKLAPGDIVYINYNSIQYTYQVTGSQVVQPTDMAVLSPTSTPTLSLITCTPPGTSLERLVVTAKQISPNPTTAQAATPTTASPQGSSLPSAAPGIMTQINNAINSIVQSFQSLFGGSNAQQPNNATPGSSNGQLPAAQ